MVIQKALAADHEVVLAETIRRDHATRLAKQAVEEELPKTKVLECPERLLPATIPGSPSPPSVPELLAVSASKIIEFPFGWSSGAPRRRGENIVGGSNRVRALS